MDSHPSSSACFEKMAVEPTLFKLSAKFTLALEHHELFAVFMEKEIYFHFHCFNRA